jgi:hypothetical protein
MKVMGKPDEHLIKEHQHEPESGKRAIAMLMKRIKEVL